METTFDVYFVNGHIAHNVDKSTIVLHLLNQTGIAYIKTTEEGEN